MKPKAGVGPTFALALRQHASGNTGRAAELYRRILGRHPRHAGSLHMLGVLAHEEGNDALALCLLRQTVALAPRVPEAHYNLGTVLAAQGETGPALEEFRAALDLNPAYADARYNLAIAALKLGRAAQAAEAFDALARTEPHRPRAWHGLGDALVLAGSWKRAAAAFETAIRIDPAFAKSYDHLGRLLMRLERFPEAEGRFRALVSHDPSSARAHYHLGNALMEQAKLPEAAEAFRQALALDTGYAEACSNLSCVLARLGQARPALATARAALASAPDLAEAHWNLGVALRLQDRLHEAEAALRRAIALRPASPEAYNNLGQTLAQQGRLDEALTWVAKAVVLSNFSAPALSNLLYLLQYCRVDSGFLARGHGLWERLISPVPKPAQTGHPNPPDPERRLRVGLMSPDFGRHPVGYFLRGVLPRIDRRRFEMVCYSDRLVEDEITAELKAASDRWRPLAGQDTEAAVKLVREDAIDILIDLAGHTAHNRLPVFARRPAPVQVTWAGYVGTTGLSAMDYLIADRVHVPEGDEHGGSETVVRMPDGYVCYSPPDYAPEVGPLPALSCGHITFGCFNNLIKINSEVIELWSLIIKRLPSARLILQTPELGDEAVRADYRARFAAAGVKPERLDLLGRSPHQELLENYRRIDLALDPFPYSGGLTTLEALWMGVPVITMAGATFASRHSANHLQQLGLAGDFVARNPQDYLALAVRWSRDLKHLAHIRQTLRGRMRQSPLCDAACFTGNIEMAWREMWRAWCRRKPPSESPIPNPQPPIRVAVVTPYCHETEAVLRRCHESVRAQTAPCTHFLVADGHPSAAAAGWQARHIVLETAHDDNGNTPRATGSRAATAEGFDAIAYLDGDNWFYPNHVQAMLDLQRATGAAVCTASREIHAPDGSRLPLDPARDESDGVEFADTSCLFLTRAAFDLAPLWASMPAELGPYCDRVFWRAIRGRGLATAHHPEPTVAFTSRYAAHYHGVEGAAGLKSPDDMAGRLARDEGGASAARYLAAVFGEQP